jgi:hypothetical protein
VGSIVNLVETRVERVTVNLVEKRRIEATYLSAAVTSQLNLDRQFVFDTPVRKFSKTLITKSLPTTEATETDHSGPNTPIAYLLPR